MFDAGEGPFAENIQLIAEYVEKVWGRVLVEGAEVASVSCPARARRCSSTHIFAEHERPQGWR
jgi:hypothetical protein